MNEPVLPVGKTRYTRYTIAYHLVWIPKYRLRVLSGEVQAKTKRLIRECWEWHGLTLLALETDEDHIPVFVNTPPRFSPASLANLFDGYSSRFLREKSLASKKLCGKEQLWPSSYNVGTAGAVRQRPSSATSPTVMTSEVGSLSYCPLKGMKAPFVKESEGRLVLKSTEASFENPVSGYQHCERCAKQCVL